MGIIGKIFRWIVGGAITFAGSVFLVAALVMLYTTATADLPGQGERVGLGIASLVVGGIGLGIVCFGISMIQNIGDPEPVHTTEDKGFFKGSIPQGAVLMVIGLICLGISFSGSQSHLIIRGTDDLVPGGVSYGWFGLVFGALRMLFRLAPDEK